ncbi:hypothetical protein Ciccas_011570, partial [Cichlidogyrus casuarinus]
EKRVNFTDDTTGVKDKHSSDSDPANLEESRRYLKLKMPSNLKQRITISVLYPFDRKQQRMNEMPLFAVSWCRLCKSIYCLKLRD